MDILHLFKTILGALPFLVLCLVNLKINLNKTKRYRQFLMPFIALIYCIAAVCMLDFVNNLVFKFFNWAAGYIPFLKHVAWQSIMTFVLNTVFVTGFVTVKSVLLPIISSIWKSSKIAEATSGAFYEKDEDVDKWVLKKSCANLRSYLKGFYIASIIISSLVFVLSQNYPASPFFKAAFYPIFGVIVLGEVYTFLSGITKTEFIEDILGEDEESYKIANYGILREILRDLFPERVLHDGTCDASDGISVDFDELDEMASSEDRATKLIGSYFQNLKKGGADVDINYVKSTLNLLNGKSTLFCNPFYNDLTHYITLPIVKQLISYKKCLIVLGRDSALQDVKSWIDAGLENFTGTESLWQAEVLDEYSSVSDVGIIKFSDIHNLKIHKANKQFLSKVGFVLIIEPSRILASGQIGLSLLVNSCEGVDKNLVFCACDRNCDGLVDALSHTLKTSITEVTATIIGSANNSQMYWNADGPYMHHKIFPNVSRYLGMGTEINAVAMKYQLDRTGWIGSEKFPVIDMKWIAGQYHKTICNYADLPESQASFDRSFNVSSNLWSVKKQDNLFLVVEDEFQNLFEMTRVFASRAKNQGFVNVISENYFLRDYMIENVEVFSADPKAIPTIVPDFARTERNMVLKLIMLMVSDVVSEERIAKELMLCGINFTDPYSTFKSLIIKHCNVKDASLSVRFREELQSDSLSSVVVKYYEINETNELYDYAKRLSNAYYIAEDEKGESHYIGSKLYGHVFQAALPGQFVTIDGKYYEIQTVTPMSGVVVRRAADHITGRSYYRQIRRIMLNNWAEGTEMGSQRISSDIEISRGYADIDVETDGYLEMSSYGDLANAKKISVNGIPSRSYKNKSVLKIRLPGNSTSRIRYTICLLLNEVFRTTYPETYHYISALTPYCDELKTERLTYASYRLDGSCEEDCIYIIEDSDIDLGLIVSVERNLKRYLEIIAEVLAWHSKKMAEKPAEKPSEDEAKEESAPDFGEKPETKRKGLRGLIDRIKAFFKKLFGKRDKNKPKNGDDEAKPDAEKPQSEPQTENSEKPDETADEAVDNSQASDDNPAEEVNSVDEADAQGDDVQPEAEPKAAKKSKKSKKNKKKDADGKRKGFFGRMFGKKKKSEPKETPSEEATPEQTPEEEVGAENIAENAPAVNDSETSTAVSQEDERETVLHDTITFFDVSGVADEAESETDAEPENGIEDASEAETEPETETDTEVEAAAEDIDGEDEELDKSSGEATEYQKHCFLKFGYDKIDEVLDIEGACALLQQLGFDNSALQQVREASENGADENYDPHKYGAHLCDFCGVELLGGEYELLKDGRERCNRCSMTAIKKVDDFKVLYKNVLRNMEAFYGIKLNAAVRVRTTNAKQIAKHVGMKFEPTPGFDGRVLGFAQRDKTGYSLYIENGSPKLAATATIAHELTHIWQYSNWNDAELSKRYGKKNMLEVYEGMAKWSEIQYLLLMNEKSYAKRQAITTLLRDDEYGRGFRLYIDKYPLSYNSTLNKTPFKENPPL